MALIHMRFLPYTQIAFKQNPVLQRCSLMCVNFLFADKGLARKRSPVSNDGRGLKLSFKQPSKIAGMCVSYPSF